MNTTPSEATIETQPESPIKTTTPHDLPESVNQDIRLWIEKFFAKDRNTKKLLSYLLDHIGRWVSYTKILALVPGRILTEPTVFKNEAPAGTPIPLKYDLNDRVRMFSESVSDRLEVRSSSPIRLKVDEWGNCLLYRKGDTPPSAPSKNENPGREDLSAVAAATNAHVDRVLDENGSMLRSHLHAFLPKFLGKISSTQPHIKDMIRYAVSELAKNPRFARFTFANTPQSRPASALHMSHFIDYSETLGSAQFSHISFRDFLRNIAAKFQEYSNMHGNGAFSIIVHPGDYYEMVIYPENLNVSVLRGMSDKKPRGA